MTDFQSVMSLLNSLKLQGAAKNLEVTLNEAESSAASYICVLLSPAI